MLEITIPDVELFDGEREEFVSIKGQRLKLEHSLVSLSKWEMKWCKPFLGTSEKTREETVDYIRCMTLTQNVDPQVYQHIPDDVIYAVNRYIQSPMTATWFRETKGAAPNREIITNELIYYWMISFHIPFECQKWHLNRLMTLIRVCQAKSEPPRKMSKSELLKRNAQINASRRRALHSKG